MIHQTDPKQFLRELFDIAVEVADPIRSLADHLPAKPDGRVVVIGAGKASARMAEAVEIAWGPCEGLVITRYGYARPCQGIEIVEAAHPVPDEAGMAATKRMLTLLSELHDSDFVLALMSGGASALLIAPAEGVSLAEKQSVNESLLASGAPISSMNTVRKHMSQVKGGQLAAAAYPAEMLSLVISDVPGDDLEFIGSGPTVGSETTAAEALGVIKQWNVKIPESVEKTLQHPIGVVVKPNDERLSRVENKIYAAPSQSLAAAAKVAEKAGCNVQMLGDDIEGEARDIAKIHAEQAKAIQSTMQQGDSPVLLLSGGELTVTRRGAGTGGPNAEYCLALSLALESAAGIYAIACDTDGVDGAAEIAGAIIGPETLTRAKEKGLDPKQSLSENDAHSFFGVIDEQVVTGPTLTNVNDFRAILISSI